MNLATGQATGGNAGTDTLISIENVYTNSGADTIVGSDVANEITSRDGNDTVSGGGGDDIIDADGGNDILHGNAGNDRFDAGFGNDQVFGDEGDDYIRQFNGSHVDADLFDGGDGFDFVEYIGPFGMIIDLAFGTATSISIGTDTLVSIEGVITGDQGDQIVGSSGDDYLISRGGPDVIAGDYGNDRLDGGSGDDVMNGGDGVDMAIYSHLASTDVTWARSANGDWIVTGPAAGVGATGTDRLLRVEYLDFTDRDVFLDRPSSNFSTDGESDFFLRNTTTGGMVMWFNASSSNAAYLGAHFHRLRQ